MALFHDRFVEFKNETKKLFLEDPQVIKLRERIKSMLQEKETLTSEDKDKLWEVLAASSKHHVQTSLLQYLNDNNHELSMYMCTTSNGQ